MLLQLAWRNVTRNRRRSAITVLSIAIGLAAMTFLWGFIDGMNRQMIQNSTRYFTADMQVHLKGYHDDPTLDLTMTEADAILRAVQAQRDVTAASVRLEGKALASHGEKSRGIVLTGIAPEAEPKVSALLNALVDGEPIRAGSTGVLIGDKLADALEVKAGGELVLVGQAYDGSVASDRYPVRGVFRTNLEDLDGYLVVLPLDSAREFYAAPLGATAIALRLADREAFENVRTNLASKLGDRYEVLGWPRLLPMVSVSVRFHEVLGYVVLTVFFVVVAAAVANPILMSVLDRTREFGIMLAVGAGRQRLLRLVLVEAILLGVLGLLLGNALGIGLTVLFARVGINLHAFSEGLRIMPGLEDIIYPVVRLNRSAAVSAIVFATACATALYPAAKAALLEPVEAIRGLTRGNKVGVARRTVPSRGRWPVFVLIATRNVLRNKRRTLITAGGAAFCIVAFIFMFGFFDGFGEQTIDNSTGYLTAHVQVERKGFRSNLAPELALQDSAALLEQIRRAPNVEAAAPRVQVQALASTAAKSEGIVLMGIDPDAERRVTFIDRTVVEGQALAPDTDREILIGRRLAEKLRVRLGEKIVVMAQAANGEIATAAFRVRGIFATESNAFDGVYAFVTLTAAQSLLDLGDRASTINIRLADRAHLEQTIEALRGSGGYEQVVFTPWQELLPQIAEMVRLNRTISQIVNAILLLVVASAVMNTVFMAVAERTREFGVMMALGTPPAAIRRMVVYETLALLTVATIIGYGLGMALVEYSGREGLDLSGLFRGYSAIPGLTGIIHPKLVLGNIVPPGLALLVAGVLVSLYPAAKAARLDPTTAIRHV
jgi:putative ABC transport system permease protein